MENQIIELINLLIKMLIIAFINESAINQVKKLITIIIKNRQARIFIVLVMLNIIAAIEVIQFQLDILYLLNFQITVIGMVLTALILSGGASSIHQLITKIKEGSDNQINDYHHHEKKELINEFNRGGGSGLSE